MTKAKAKKMMSEESRSIIDPKLASKIAKAFGYTLKNLGLVPHKVSMEYRATYFDPNDEGVGVYRLACAIASKQNPLWEQPISPFYGRGSTVEFYTEEALKVIQ